MFFKQHRTISMFTFYDIRKLSSCNNKKKEDKNQYEAVNPIIISARG